MEGEADSVTEALKRLRRVSFVLHRKRVGFGTSVEMGNEFALKSRCKFAQTVGNEKRVQSVRCEKDEEAARFENALDFIENRLWRGQVFEQPRSGNDIERVGREGK